MEPNMNFNPLMLFGMGKDSMSNAASSDPMTGINNMLFGANSLPLFSIPFNSNQTGTNNTIFSGSQNTMPFAMNWGTGINQGAPKEGNFWLDMFNRMFGNSGGSFAFPQFPALNPETPADTNTYNADTKYFNYDFKLSKQLESKNLSPEFYSKINDISKKLKCDPVDLLAIMNNESGISPSESNPSSNATGLIQFMPDTARRYGTTVEKLKVMSAEDQLAYVDEFLKRAKKQAGIPVNKEIDGATLYALIFYPKNAAKDVLVSNGTAAYAQNPLDKVGIDGSKGADGKISKADLKYYVDKQRKALGYNVV